MPIIFSVYFSKGRFENFNKLVFKVIIRGAEIMEYTLLPGSKKRKEIMEYTQKKFIVL